MTPFVLELGLSALLLIVFLATLFARGEDRRWIGWLALAGVVILTVVALARHRRRRRWAACSCRTAWPSSPRGSCWSRRSSACSVGWRQPGPAFARRAGEYHLLLLASLLGMLVLASARDLVLLFVAFELMSIPLYVLAGFVKREGTAVEAALKFFLVGSVSSAVMVYGLSFVYGAARTTALGGVAKAMGTADPLLMLGLLAAFAGFGFKIAAFPFHMWVPDTYEAGSTPFVAWLSVAPKAAGFVALFRVYFEGVGADVSRWMPLAAGLAALTIVGGNLMALPQQNAKRLLAYSGIAHIGYMLVGFAAASASGTAMVLFYLVAYVFGNMGAFLVVDAVARAEGSEHVAAFRGLAQRSPLLALAMLLFLLSLGGIPFVAGFWAKLYVFWAAVTAGLYWLVLLGAVLTVVALFYYLIVARRMYIDPPSRVERVPLQTSLALAVLLCVLGVVILGVYPGPVVMAALRVAAPLF